MWAFDDWRWEDISPYLSDTIGQKLKAIQVIPEGEEPDRLYWAHTQSGLFTTGSALGLIRGVQVLPRAPVWKHIWRAPAQQRARTFAYLAAHNAMLCNVNRVRRHLSQFAACPRCGLDETTLHLLRDCEVIKAIWRLLGNNSLRHGFFLTTEIQEWIMLNVQKEDRWAAIFVTMLWLTWKTRNELVFQGSDRVQGIADRVWQQVAWYRRAAERERRAGARSDEQGNQSRVRWEPPDDGWLKLNTDGVSKGNPGMAGGGGVIRDHRGAFIKGFAFKCGFCSAEKAETWALLRGVQVAKDMGISKLLIEMDNANICAQIQCLGTPEGENGQLITRCRALIRSIDWEVKARHTRRQANVVADTLANFAVTMTDSLVIFDVVPDCICALVPPTLPGGELA